VKRPDDADVIDLRAADPDGDLACDFTIATSLARDGIRDALAAALIPPVRDLADGVEVRFRAEAWPAVERYVRLESQCCSFLTLAAERRAADVLLRVTGRPDARDLIRAIFAGVAPPAGQ
jgi:hypothetical protein